MRTVLGNPKGDNRRSTLRAAESGDVFGVANVPFVADGQLVAALGPTAGQYGASVFGLHALTEAVGLRPLPVVRLKCTFRHLSSFLSAGKHTSTEALRVGIQNSDYKGYACEVQTCRLGGSGSV